MGPRHADVPMTTRQAFRQVFPGVMLAMFLAAADQTILASALPTMARALGGLNDVSWVVVAYLLAATVAAPMYGHLGDRFGRRKMLLVALGVFTVASLACALAPGFYSLVAARALQGLGGGGLMTLSQALIGENISPRERGRFAGYFAMVFALASTSGPVAGAYLTEHFSWRATFLVNLPLGLLAALLALRIPVAPREPQGRFELDWRGAVLYASSIVLLLFALSSAGHRFAWTSWELPTLVLLALMGLVWMVQWEHRAPDPVIPVQLLSKPVILRSNAVVLCFAAALFSSVLYLPLYLQLGRGIAIGESGLLLLPMTLSMVAASALSGTLVSRTGQVNVFPRSGLCLSTVVWLGLAGTLPHLPAEAIMAGTALAGIGLGMVMPATQVIVQTVAGPALLGRATASVSLSRAVGGALGVALIGALVFALVSRVQGPDAQVLQAAMKAGPEALAQMSLAGRAVLRGQLDQTFQLVFGGIGVITGLGAALSFAIPKIKLG